MPLSYERRKEYEKRYYQEHKEKRKAYVKEWRLKRSIEGLEKAKVEVEKAKQIAAWKATAEVIFLENMKKAQG